MARMGTRMRQAASTAELLAHGPYCASCGQKAHVHRSLRGFFHRLRPGRCQLRREDLADPADARLAAGRDDAPLYRRGAGAVHLARSRSTCSPSSLMFAVLNFTGALNADAESFEAELQEEIAETQRDAGEAGGEPGGRMRPRLSDALAESIARLPSARRSIADSQRMVDRQPLIRDELDRTLRMGPAIGRRGPGKPGAGVPKDPGSGIEVQLAADPDFGAVPVAAVPASAAPQPLRPHGLRYLFAVVHDDAA